MTTDELHYKIYKQLDTNPKLSQRELAESLGVSLGKANYCLRALITKGLVKARNFRKSNNKLAYMYLLTPKGIEEKACLTSRFLKYKLMEYESLKKEIAELQRDCCGQNKNENIQLAKGEEV